MKHSLPIFCAAALSFGSLHAQSPLLLTHPNVPVEYYVTNVSPNGKWACGHIQDGYVRAFRWNLTTGEIRELSLSGDRSAAFGVSNDGKVAGMFQDSEGNANHASQGKAGYWFDGRWHHVDDLSFSQDAEGIGSMAYCISPNGKLLGGIAEVEGHMLPVSWNLETGEMTTYTCSSVGAVYGIADNGVAVGWTNRADKQNRTPLVWMTPTDTVYVDYESVGPFSTCNAVSPNGNKVLVGSGKIYDVATRTFDQAVSHANLWAFEFNRITDDGSIVGYTQNGMDDSSSAAIYTGGKLYKMTDYLASRGVNIDGYPYIYLSNGISNDLNTIHAWALSAEGTPRAFIVKLGENTVTPSPVNLTAHALTGAQAVQLNWNSPLYKGVKVSQYELYRGSEKVYAGTDSTFIDKNLSDGNYSYTVKAVYDAGTSDASDAAAVALANTVAANAPVSLQATQRGMNNVGLIWEKPAPALASYAYSPANAQVYSTGGGIYSFETGVRFSSDLLASYAEKGQVVKGVSFYPMSKIKGWKVNIYAADDLKTPLYTQDVDDSKFVYGQANYVALNTPFTAPAGKDIVVGIESNVDEDNANYAVQGFFYGVGRRGYTDLMHRVNLSTLQEDFYSLYDYALDAQGDESASFVYESTWPTALSFGAANGGSAEAQNYVVYADGQQVALTGEPQTILPSQADGEHTYGVAARYADGSESAKSEVTLNVKKDLSVVTPQNLTVSVNGKNVHTSWDAVPAADCNRSKLQYCGEDQVGSMLGSEANNWSYMVKNIYGSDMLRPYEGYQITGVRFYPLANAEFTFHIQQGNSEEKTDVEVGDNYTVGQWNEVKLDQPIAINRNSELSLVLDMWDVEIGKAPLGVDNTLCREQESDLYSLDEGETWKSLVEEASQVTGNWMIGLIVETPEGTPVEVKGYNVYSDGQLSNSELLQTTSYDYTVATNGLHKVHVRAMTDKGNGSTDPKFFNIGTTGLSDVTSELPIVVAHGTDAIRVSGGEVASLKLYTAGGAQCAAAQGNEIGIASLPAGTYVLAVQMADGKVYNQKVAL